MKNSFNRSLSGRLPRHCLVSPLLGALLGVCCALTARAQVVQLPSVQTFGTSGAVSVPDSGDGYLGGNRSMRSGSGAAGYGPVRNRSIGSQSGAGSMSATAVVLDLQAMDQAILQQAEKGPLPSSFTGRSYNTPVVNTLTPKFYTRQTRQGSTRTVVDPNAWQIALGASGAAEIGHAGALVHDDTDVRYYMQKAAEANYLGRISASQVYYQMALDRLTPEQRKRMQQIQTADEAAAKDNNSAAVAKKPSAGSGDAPPGTSSSAPTPSAGPAGSSESSPFDAPPAASDASPLN